MLINKEYTCKIYTLNGIFPATCKLSERLIHGQESAMVTSKDKVYRIFVYRSLAEHKLLQEESPTFYAC